MITQATRTLQQTLRKVPEITALFWITKLFTTAMGEALADFLGNGVNPILAAVLGVVGFGGAFVLQFRAHRYIPAVYWFAVAMVATFGTGAADVVHLAGLPYPVSTAFFAVVLGVVFALWHRSEGSLSIHTITTRRREIFYWVTVISTFSLGTAAGDWTANSLGLGFFGSGVLFAALMIVPVIASLVGVDEVFTFWFAYIITRPLGASFADWFGKARPQGLGWGDGPTSLILAIGLIICVAFMMFDRTEREAETRAQML